MAKNRGGMTRTTTTTEHLQSREGDPIAAAVREGLKEYAKLDIGGYAMLYWESVSGFEDARLDVFKKMHGHFMKVGTLQAGEVDPEDMESHVITTWQPGLFQLRPIVGFKYYAPASMGFHVGEADEKPAARGSDLSSAIGALAELGAVKQLKELKEGILAGERPREDEGMKGADVQAMMTSALEPLKMMLTSAERRAEVAEQRNHELQMKLMEMANGRQQTVQGGIGELLKLLPKESLTALLAPADTPGWAEKAVDALREFGPALAQMLVEYFRPGAGAAGAAPGTAALPPARLPQSAESQEPTSARPSSGGSMPLTLNPEQIEAKKLFLECLQTKDFANAYGMIENFPGFTPTVNGPMPIGSAFLTMIDPTITKPRIYVIQMMQLVPELAGMLAEADAFIIYVQQRLMKDQEAYLKEQRARQRNSTEPKPTTYDQGDEN